MNLFGLILRELRFRMLNTALSVVSIAVAVACLVGSLYLLRADDLKTASILAEKQESVKKAGADLEDSMRKIMKGLGFNIIILPKEQDLHEMHVEGTLSATMPESYVDKLAQSKIVTINHLLPTVTKKLKWPETGMDILLYGTRGEVPLAFVSPKKPILDNVPRGSMIVGHAIQQKLGLKEGAETTLMGHAFKVIKIHPERGSIDDSTVWINLREAQEMLGMENLVHAIQALECECAGDRITKIRQDITEVLPGTQVIERGSQALARAEARNKAKETAEATLAEETASRAALKDQRERAAGLLTTVMFVGAAVWVGFLALLNVRQRRMEIGILRAIGLKSTTVLGVFLGKAVVIGLTGALPGVLLGWIVAGELTGTPATGATFSSQWLLLALVTAPLLAGIASWLPAFLAARQDPAVIFQTE